MSAVLMAKFPSQNKLMYVQQNGVSNDAWTVAQSGGVAGHLNLPKDLSALNRRGYASTTSKGVPLVFRCKVDLFATNYDGTGTSAAVGSDFVTTLRAIGCQNNWVMRNAAVKFHAAREKMYRDAGVKKAHRGTYAKEIRYGFDSYNDAWIVPIDGDGAAFAGGTWDQSELAHAGDSSVMLKLVGSGIDENAADDATALQIGFSYLSSRGQPLADSNVDAEAALQRHSILRNMLSPQPTNIGIADDVTDAAKAEGDNPPYDEWATNDTDNDITEPVELGRVLVGPGAQQGSMIIDIPFGLASLYLQHYDAADTDTTHNPMWTVEVLDIFEMQG